MLLLRKVFRGRQILRCMFRQRCHKMNMQRELECDFTALSYTQTQLTAVFILLMGGSFPVYLPLAQPFSLATQGWKRCSSTRKKSLGRQGGAA